MWCLRLVVSRKKKTTASPGPKQVPNCFFSGETVLNGRSEARHFYRRLRRREEFRWNLSMVWPQAVVMKNERLVFDSRNHLSIFRIHLKKNDVISDQRHKTANVWRYARNQHVFTRLPRKIVFPPKNLGTPNGTQTPFTHPRTGAKFGP